MRIRIRIVLTAASFFALTTLFMATCLASLAWQPAINDGLAQRVQRGDHIILAQQKLIGPRSRYCPNPGHCPPGTCSRFGDTFACNVKTCAKKNCPFERKN